MRVRNIPAEQAHAIPKRAYMPASPFDRELTIPERVQVPTGGPDDGGGYTPMGGTAQNGFKEVKWFRCRDCHALVRESYLEGHQCEELTDEYPAP